MGLDEVLEQGGALFVEREIGAEDYLTSAKIKLEKSGYTVYKANAGSSSVFIDAMPDSYAERLTTPTPTKLLAAYVLNEGGSRIAGIEKIETIGSDALTSMLGAINDFVKDSLQFHEFEEGGLEGIGYDTKNPEMGTVNIGMDQHKRHKIVYIYKGKGSESELKKDVARVHNELVKEHGDRSLARNVSSSSPVSVNSNKKLHNLFSSGKYDGLVLDTLDSQRIAIFENTVEAIAEEAGKNSVAILIDDIQMSNSNTMAQISYVIQNLPDNVSIIAQCETETTTSITDYPILANHIPDLKKRGLYDSESVKSEEDIETIVSSRLAGVDENDLTLLYYAAVAGKFDPEVISSASITALDEVVKIKEKFKKAGILKNGHFSNSRLRERALERVPNLAEVEIILGKAYSKLGKEQTPKAAKLLLPHAQNPEIKDLAIRTSLRAAEKEVTGFNTDEAIDFYKKANELDEDTKRKMSTLKKLIDIEWVTSNLDKMYEDVTELESLAEQEGEKSMLGFAKWSLAKLYGSQERFDEALENISVAESIFEELNDNLGYIRVLINEGTIKTKSGRLEDSLIDAEDALQLAKEKGHKKEEAFALSLKSRCLTNKGKLDEAKGTRLEALEIYEGMGDLSAAAIELSGLALIGYLKNHEEGVEYGLRSLRLAEKTHNYSVILDVSNTIGAILADKLNDPDGAEEHYQRAIRLARKIDNVSELRSGLGNLAEVKWAQKRRLIEEAEAIGEQSGMLPLESIDDFYLQEYKEIMVRFGITDTEESQRLFEILKRKKEERTN